MVGVLDPGFPSRVDSRGSCDRGSPRRTRVRVVRAVLASALAFSLASLTGATATAGADTSPGVFSWGGNAHGQLGDGTTAPAIAPLDVIDLGPGGNIIDVEAGGSFSLALTSSGSVLSWGSNEFAQLGSGTDIDERPRPGLVAGLPGPAGGIAAGAEHAVVAMADGSAAAWGYNNRGQVGDGTTQMRYGPVQVDGIGPGAGVVDVAAGFYHSLALLADGTVLAWGDNEWGQLGDGTTTNRSTPVQVSGLGPGSGVVAVAAGLWHSLALKADGTVLAWGDNDSGQVGASFGLYADNRRASPVQVSGLGPGSGVIDIDGGGNVSLAAKSDGSALAWGMGSYGRRCDGSWGGPSSEPTTIPYFPPGSGIIEVAGGWQHTLLRRDDGTVFGCGFNGNGELGDGAGGVGDSGSVYSVSPVVVTGTGAGTGAVAIAAGYSHSLLAAVQLTDTGDPVTAPPNDVAIGDVVVREGDSGRRLAYVTLTLERPAVGDATVVLRTTSQLAGTDDYRPMLLQSVRIPSGQSSKVIALPIYGDLDLEADQPVSVEIVQAFNVGVADDEGTVTIAGDDAPSAAGSEVSVSDVTAYEGDSKTKLTFTISLNRASFQEVVVRFRTTGGTATGSVDYLAKSGTNVKFMPGQTSKAVSVTVPGDVSPESVESFGVALSSATGAVIADPTGTGTIIDDDI